MYCSAAGNDIDKSDRQFLSTVTALLLHLTRLTIHLLKSCKSEMKYLIWSNRSHKEY